MRQYFKGINISQKLEKDWSQTPEQECGQGKTKPFGTFIDQKSIPPRRDPAKARGELRRQFKWALAKQADELTIALGFKC